MMVLGISLLTSSPRVRTSRADGCVDVGEACSGEVDDDAALVGVVAVVVVVVVVVAVVVVGVDGSITRVRFAVGSSNAGELARLDMIDSTNPEERQVIDVKEGSK
jgi:hypothetical protein